MDIAFPYAEDEDRLRLLYRLPLPDAAADLLIVGGNDVASVLARGWNGSHQWAASGDAAVATRREFDVVALPDMAAAGRRAAQARTLLARAYSVLRPGGWVVGHLDQACTLRGLLGGAGWGAALAPRKSPGRPQGCSNALREVGFRAPAVWYVQPSIESPMGLIPTEPVAARAQFLRLVRAARGRHGIPGHALRLTLARLGLGGLQQGQLFFWAQRPC